MKILILILMIIPLLNGCGFQEAKGSEPADIECKIFNAWDFKRCENSEVVCYVVGDNGLSCKWK